MHNQRMHHIHTTKHGLASFGRLFSRDMRHLQRVIIFTVLSISLFSMGWGFADPFFSVYLSAFSEEYEVIGLFKTIAAVATVLIIIPVGEILDRTAHRGIINWAKCGYVLVAFGYFFAGLWTSTPLLVGTLILNGVLLPMVWVSTVATLRDHASDKESGLAYGLYITGRQLAYAIGIGLSLLMISQLPVYYTFLPLAVLTLVSLCISPKEQATPRMGLRAAVHDVLVKDKVVVGFFKQWKAFDMETWLMMILFFLTSVVEIFSLVFIPLFAIHSGFTLLQTGLLVLVMNIPFLLSVFAAELADRGNRLFNVILGTGVSASAIALLSVWNEQHWHVYVLGMVVMLGQSLIQPALSSVISLRTPQHHNGVVSAGIDLMLFAAAIVFPPMLGWFIDSQGWSGTFRLIAFYLLGLMVLTIIIHWVFSYRNRTAHQQHPRTEAPYTL